MRRRGLGPWPILSLLVLLIGCGLIGPNTFRVRGTILHPLHDGRHDDPDAGVSPRILTIRRKETRVQVLHTIVGPQKTPMALSLLGEFCEIMADKATTGRLIFQCLLFSNEKDELTEMKQVFTLRLPDGRNIPGRLHRTEALQDHTVMVTGAHQQPYAVMKDRENKTILVDTYVQEVENEFPLFSRAFQVIFEDKNLLDLETPYVTLTIDGDQRRWIYRFDFTNDPNAAMRWWINHME